MKKFFKIVLYTVLGTLALILLAAGITQTQFFRDRLRSAALSSLDSLLIAEVELGELTGNLVTGFSVNHLSIIVENDTLVVADRLDLRYDLFGIPGNHLSVETATLVRPRISLVRGMDGVWNFTRMIRPSAEDTSTTGPFAWFIDIGTFSIENGTLSLIDSATLAEPDHVEPDGYSVEYHRFNVQQLALQASVLLEPGLKRATIDRMSFAADEPAIGLEGLSGTFTLTPDSTTVTDLAIKTSRSNLRLSISVADFDVLEGVSFPALRHNSVALKLISTQIDLNELDRFIPELGFLNGVVAIHLETSGELEELTLDRLDVRTGNSILYITGEVFNLHQPEDLLLNVHFTGSKIVPSDAQNLLPTITLPDLDALGTVLLNLDFEGTPLDFKTKFFARTDAGNVGSDVALKIGGVSGLAYSGVVRLQNVNPGKVFGSPSLNGNLNVSIQANGEGVDLETLASRFEIQIDSSEFLNQPVTATTFSFDAVNGGIAGSMDIRLGTMHSKLSAQFTDIEQQNSAFRIQGNIASLNIADLVRDSAHTSDLTMDVVAEGTGLSWDQLSGEFNLDIVSSSYADYRIESSNLRILLDQQMPDKRLFKVQSNIADFTLSGQFDIEYLTSLIGFELQNIQLAIGEKFTALDTTIAADIDRTALTVHAQTLAAQNKKLDMSYMLQLKNLEPVSRIASDRIFNGTGTLRGSVLGDYKNLSLDGRLMIQDFFYGNADSGLLIEDGEISFQITDLKPVAPLKGLEVWILSEAAKMHLNRTRMDSLELTFKYTQEYSSYGARTKLDEDLRLGVQGIASISSDQVVFTLNTLGLTYKDYAWKAQGGASVGFSNRGISVKDLTIERDTQIIQVSGSIGNNGLLSASVDAKNLDLSGLKYFLSPGEGANSTDPFSGVAHCNLTAGGTLAHPEYEATVRAERFAFRSIPFGEIRGSFGYKSGGLRVQMDVNEWADRTSAPELVVRGLIPMDLSMARDSSAPVLPPMDLHITSTGVQMGILDPILPTFSQLSGRLTCDVKLEGSLDDPTTSGSIRIDSCMFEFVPNNIWYMFEGEFKPSGERIEVLRAVVRNVSGDRRLGRNGEINISGDFGLREFKPTNFDLTAVGQLLVVKETTRKSSLSIYGDLFIETNSSGLNFSGTLDRSLLKGYVLVRNSSLVFPPTESSNAKTSGQVVPVFLIDDTSTVVVREDDRSAVALYFSSASRLNEERATVVVEEGKSFLDGLRYDLEIESRGSNTEIRMIFNPTTGEELVANLEGRFRILEDGTQWIGVVTVDRAYYNFTKRFDAEGTLRFTGNFLNPELDITARYRGTRTLSDSLGSRTEPIVVILEISGTRFEPSLEISMTIDGQDYYSYTGPKSSDVNSDAIQFLITGSFPLTESQKNDIASDIRSTVGSSLVTGATSLLSSTLSEFLRRETGFITSIELGYGAEGNIGESADIRISGVVGDGLWRIGGKVLNDPFNNANVSLIYSLGDIFRKPSLRNLMFELERRVETTVGQLADRKEINSARLFYRFSF
ncbi:MAG: hypothetical protein ACKVRP_00830 [Bacteroidota bacterium]